MYRLRKKFLSKQIFIACESSIQNLQEKLILYYVNSISLYLETNPLIITMTI